MRIERVLVILCSVILLATMLAVSLPSQTTLALPGELSVSLDGDAAVVVLPTFDSFIMLPSVVRSFGP